MTTNILQKSLRRLKMAYCSSELIGLYDVIPHLMSLTLWYGARLEKVSDILTGLKSEPCGGHLETEHWKQRT